MAAKISAVVDVRTEQLGISVYGLFKDCGPIASMHPWKKDSDAENIGHYFVVFDEPAGALRAAAISAPVGVSVTPVITDADLASAYMRLHMASSSSNSTADTTTAPPTPTRGTASSSLRSSMNVDMPPPPVPAKAAASAPARTVHVNGDASTPRPEPSTFLRQITDTDNNSRFNPPSTAPSSSTSDMDKAASIVTSDIPPLDVKLGLATMTPPTGFPTSLEVQYMGAPIRLDLTSLSPDNPRSLISLLTKLGADRASWMIAGAFFRRTGHPDTALSIALAMIDVFRKAGSSEQDLKPAFLFLSGCHTDLVRHAPQDSSSRANSINHAEEASRLLRKAYGTQRPDPSLDNPEPSQPQAVRVGGISDTANNNTSNGKSNKRQRTAQNVGSGSSEIGQTQILQREIQSLRDRNAHLDKQLRKAEREAAEANAKLAAERVARKKAEAMAGDASREIDAARAAQRAAEDARNDMLRRMQHGPPLPQRSSGMPGHMHMHDHGMMGGNMGPGPRKPPPPLPSTMSRYSGPPPPLGPPANPPPIFMGMLGSTG